MAYCFTKSANVQNGSIVLQPVELAGLPIDPIGFEQKTLHPYQIPPKHHLPSGRHRKVADVFDMIVAGMVTVVLVATKFTTAEYLLAV